MTATGPTATARPLALSTPSGPPRLLATVGSPGLAGHLRHWGHRPPAGPRLLDELGRSGLFGRGGAGFPAAAKWETLRLGCPPTVIANATEGEPASNKDKVLVQHAPHLVLDGIVGSAEALGAPEAVLCLDRRSGRAIEAASRALSERAAVGLDPIPIRIETIPTGYVTGEESALVSWLDGGPARPTGRRPFSKGVGGRPALVNNVETLANVAMIARFGSAWYRQAGTPDSPGTTLVTVTGDVARPAVSEIALGTTIGRVVASAGPTSTPQAVLVGGYFGVWLPGPEAASAGMGRDALRRFGASVGCGALVVVGERSCGLATAAAITRWMAGQSAGQCGPCTNGLPAIADAVDRLVAGRSAGRDLDLLDRWIAMMEGRGACKHPDGTVRMVRSALGTFDQEIRYHAAHGPCHRPAAPVALPRTWVARPRT